MTHNDTQTKLFDGVVIFTQVINCGSFFSYCRINRAFMKQAIQDNKLKVLFDD